VADVLVTVKVACAPSAVVAEGRSIMCERVMLALRHARCQPIHVWV
jgi:hypothetical protein